MQSLIKTIGVAMATLLLTIAAASSAMAKGPTSVQLPPAFSGLQQRLGVTVIKKFPTDTPAMTGYVVKNGNGSTGLIFSVGPYLISGTLIDAHGNDATARFAQRELPQPNYQDAARELAKDPTLITEGSRDAPAVYVFADPNCIFCHKFWKMTRAWVNAGKLQIHWVMVGFLKASSAGKAAAMMAKRTDSGDIVGMDESGFDIGNEEGAIKPLKTIPQALKQALHRHSRMMSKLGFNGTPSLIYQDHRGHWQGAQGVPTMATLGTALGIR